LQQHLAEAYLGQTMTFEELLNTDYPEGLWLEPEYRAAVLAMAERDEVDIERKRSTPTGRAPRGLQLPDEITVSGQARFA
jgi:hypothetical protein